MKRRDARLYDGTGTLNPNRNLEVREVGYRDVLEKDSWRDVHESSVLERLSVEGWTDLVRGFVHRDADARHLVLGPNSSNPDYSLMDLVINEIREGYVNESAQGNLRRGQLACIREAHETRENGEENGRWGDREIYNLFNLVDVKGNEEREFWKHGKEHYFGLLEALPRGKTGINDPYGIILELVSALDLKPDVAFWKEQAQHTPYAPLAFGTVLRNISPRDAILFLEEIPLEEIYDGYRQYMFKILVRKLAGDDALTCLLHNVTQELPAEIGQEIEHALRKQNKTS